MDPLLEMASRGFEQMVGRLSGPLNFRLLVMPTVVTVLAIRAGLRDAREGRPPFVSGFLFSSVDRRGLIRSALRDAGKVFLMAVLLDTAYQLMVFRWWYPVQVFTVAVLCAIVPYVVVRGPVTRLARALRKDAHPAEASAAGADAPPGPRVGE